MYNVQPRFINGQEQPKNKTTRQSAETLSPGLNTNRYEGAIMSCETNRRIPSKVQASTAVNEAWREHQALLIALRDAPSLSDRPEFIALRMDAFERFSNAYGGA